jgi:tRNA U34 5-carboxymethylaminomethyl modifying GTPase MnmE/TrmE
MTETKVNGGAEFPELNAANAKAYEYSVAVRLDLEQRLGAARDEIADLRQQLTGNAVEIEGLRSLRNHFENMMHEYAVERDGAVADRAKCESIIENLRSILRDYPITGGKDNAH